MFTGCILIFDKKYAVKNFLNIDIEKGKGEDSPSGDR